MKWITAIPVYNEVRSVPTVLAEVRRYSPEILVIDDGSTDGTAELLKNEPNIKVLTHPQNRGYGAALRTAFEYARENGYEVLVTMDCDGQHEPGRIPVLLEAMHGVNIVSGSRYYRDFRQDTPAPTDRRFINATITKELNDRFGLNITDAFCGFKAYDRRAIELLHSTEPGWGMPLELWVQAAKRGLTVREIGVPRLYLDPSRTFGGLMNQPDERLRYYREVIDRAAQTCPLGMIECPVPIECWEPTV
ncbi:glycosyltransferase family 2 protein [Zavarzinella formosa]|uniref:glycosyltransferase family 2 protein n=1 Tax=Zavarzinella formosa TaxID=360055 RepID=UPI0002F980BB|nr:glycosyltransferase family 2 protein [Zavarzinella formosa]